MVEFAKQDENNWVAWVDCRELQFLTHGSDIQEAGSNCTNKIQEYIDGIQEAQTKKKTTQGASVLRCLCINIYYISKSTKTFINNTIRDVKCV